MGENTESTETTIVGSDRFDRSDRGIDSNLSYGPGLGVDITASDLNSFEKRGVAGYGSNLFVTKTVDGVLSALSVVATFSFDFGLLYWINGLRGALKKFTQKK